VFWILEEHSISMRSPVAIGANRTSSERLPLQRNRHLQAGYRHTPHLLMPTLSGVRDLGVRQCAYLAQGLEVDKDVWRPDVFRSILFLVASRVARRKSGWMWPAERFGLPGPESQTPASVGILPDLTAAQRAA
jgi:hypothetical protein